ncbi:MAG: hypothetical protein KAH00_00960 [Cocleimonas sp.]|nr:hypothetical protein [Cocleimonas sp.]
MSDSPILHVLIPDLLAPLTLWSKDFGFEAKSEITAVLLAHSEHKDVPFVGLDAAIFGLLGFSADEELPYAHFRVKKERINSDLVAHKGTFLCADPVHLKAGASEVMLDPDPLLDLTEDESTQYIALLNAHFADDGVQFVMGCCNRWYLLMDRDESIRTTPLRELRGKEISKFLPHSDKMNLHRLQNEAQMLLHSADVNFRREQEGKLAVNSLWLWGGGMQTDARTRVRTVIGGGFTGELAASVAQCRHLNIASEPEYELDQLEAGGHHLLILDQLTPFALSDDLEGWQAQLDKLESEWFAPMEKLFNKGKIKLLVQSCDGKVYIPEKKKSLNELWNKVKGNKPSIMELLK